MDDAQAALAGHGDSQAADVGHGIHRGAQKRNVQFDLIGQIGFQLDFLGQHFAAARNQQNIIKSQSFTNHFRQHAFFLLLSF